MQLTHAQQQATTFILEHEHALMSLPMGFGKTVCTLTALNELIASREVSRVLVLAPKRVANLVWAHESGKWGLPATVVACTGTAKEREATLLSGAAITVINFENIPWLLPYIGQFDALVVDEITKLKTVGGSWFKKLRKHLPQFKRRIGLTGTLAEEGIDKLYGMSLLIDGGRALGRNKRVFMSRYFDSDYLGYKFTPKEGAAEAVAAAIAPFTFVWEQDDQDLPELVVEYEYVTMPDGTRRVYNELRREMVVEVEQSEIEAINEGVLIGKLQQVCSGFLYDDDGVKVLDREKLQKIAKHVTARTGAGTMLVYQYRHELAQLRAMFPDAGVLAEDDRAAIEWNAGRLNVLLLHPDSAGHGLNLQTGGSKIVFCGPIWSRDKTDQVIARVRRRGFTGEFVHVVMMVTRGTIEDELIVPRVTGKGDKARDFRGYLCGRSSQ